MEWKRKLWHICGGSLIALIYLASRLSKIQSVAILGLIVMGYAIPDILRLYIPAMNRCLVRTFGRISRRWEERHRVTASTPFLIGSWLTILLFPKTIAIATILFATLGDTSAAILGRYGRIQVFWEKTLEGSATCFIVCLVVGLLLFRNFSNCLLLSLVGAASAAIAEMVTKGRWDNLTIPLISGAVMTLLSLF